MVKAGEPASEMTFDDVVDLLSILDGSSMPTTVDYRNGPLRLRIERGHSRTGSPVEAMTPPQPTAVEAAPPSVPTGPGVPAAPPVAPNPQSDEAVDGTPVPAPIAGVFYRAPSPGAEAFVKVGQSIQEDTVIGIVEVMKLMNTVRAGVAGVVTEICADDAALVEFEQPLIRVRTVAIEGSGD